MALGFFRVVRLTAILRGNLRNVLCLSETIHCGFAEGECGGGVPSAAGWHPGHFAGLLPLPAGRGSPAVSFEAALTSRAAVFLVT